MRVLGLAIGVEFGEVLADCCCQGMLRPFYLFNQQQRSFQQGLGFRILTASDVAGSIAAVCRSRFKAKRQVVPSNFRVYGLGRRKHT